MDTFKTLACFWIKNQCFIIDNYFVPVNLTTIYLVYIAYFGRKNKNQYLIVYK